MPLQIRPLTSLCTHMVMVLLPNALAPPFSPLPPLTTTPTLTLSPLIIFFTTVRTAAPDACCAPKKLLAANRLAWGPGTQPPTMNDCEAPPWTEQRCSCVLLCVGSCKACAKADGSPAAAGPLGVVPGFVTVLRGSGCNTATPSWLWMSAAMTELMATVSHSSWLRSSGGQGASRQARTEFRPHLPVGCTVAKAGAGGGGGWCTEHTTQPTNHCTYRITVSKPQASRNTASVIPPQGIQ